jgi:hypothetical protein
MLFLFGILNVGYLLNWGSLNMENNTVRCFYFGSDWDQKKYLLNTKTPDVDFTVIVLELF